MVHHTEIFDNVDITTKRPSVNLKVTNVGFGNINYLITTDNSYNIDSGTLKVYVNNEEVYSGNVSISGNTTGKINVNAVSGDYIELLLTDVKSNGRVIKNVKSSDKFIY